VRRREKTLKAIVEPRAARANRGHEFRHAEPLVNADEQGPAGGGVPAGRTGAKALRRAPTGRPGRHGRGRARRSPEREEDPMSIELYAFPPSPRAFKAMVVANHLGLDWTLRMIDLRKGEQKAPHYAALNPNMRMPTLKDGDYVLWESNAIIRYLATKQPQSGLLPTDEAARLDVTRWQFWDTAHWDPACAVFAFEHVVKPRLLGIAEPDAAAVAKGTEAFHRAAPVLDGQLKNRTFVTGETLTLADFSIGSAMILADLARYPLEPYGEIKRWCGQLRALPAWKATLAQAAMPEATAA
jgi:glutathione S-transferase